YYGEAEILYWFIRRGSVPPLLTTGDPGGFGVIGTDNTQVLLNNLDFDQGHRVGGRFLFGFWAANLPRIAFEAGYFFLGEVNPSIGFTSTGTPLLARPFFNVNTGREDSSLIAFPNLQAGAFQVSELSRLWGAEVNTRALLYQGKYFSFQGLTGVRFIA